MLIPKKVKHRKWQRGRSRFKPQRATTLITLAFGEYGLKATGKGWLTSRQIEAARRVLVRYTRKGGRIWTRVFPDRPVTSKGTHFTMGSGKGAPDHFVFVVKPGMVLFEMGGIPMESAKEALLAAAHKLPFKTKFVTSEDQ